ncbi:MAG TPA: AbrB family transcriptional regulator [Desulforhopalus sp.]|jgi:uncharacterized protein|nr:AbrB family transcriptional regulator [Desulforhopalus sp.]
MGMLGAAMRRHAVLQVLVTLGIGVGGATAALWAGLPAAGLIGSALAVSTVSFFRLPTAIPLWLRNCAFAGIGCSLGSGVSRDLLALAATWPVSLLGLVVAMAAILASGSWVLVRFFRHSRETALLATAPGALSYSLAIAASGVGDAGAVIVIQSIRLLFIATGLPLVIDLVDPHQGSADVALIGTTGPAATALLFFTTLALGFILQRYRVAAAFLLAGVLISGLLHYTGMVHGRPPTSFLLVGFVITGAVVGSRFSVIPLAEIRRSIVAALVLVLLSSVVAALFAGGVAQLTGLPFGQVWVAYAPGGVEAMAAMALALGYDPAFIATHHLSRIVLLLFSLSLLLRLFRSPPVDPVGGR